MLNEGEYIGSVVGAVWDTVNPGTDRARPVVRMTVQVEGTVLNGTLWLDNDQPDKLGRTAREKTFSLLRSVGWKGARDLGMLAGKVSVTVEHKVSPTTGRVYANAKYINEIRGMTANAPPSDAMLNAILGSKAPSPVAPDTGVDNPADAPGDDIPF